jgi:hypothetical protein
MTGCTTLQADSIPVVPGLSSSFVEDAGNQFIGLIRWVKFLEYWSSLTPKQ